MLKLNKAKFLCVQPLYAITRLYHKVLVLYPKFAECLLESFSSISYFKKNRHITLCLCTDFYLSTQEQPEFFEFFLFNIFKNASII